MNNKFEKELSKGEFRVTIFGSARIKPTNKIYKEVHELAKLIAHEGIDIVTGGGPGLMKAANQGHKAGQKKGINGKVHSIGLGIRLPWEQHYNKSVDVKRTFNKFSNRLDNFMLLSNAIVVAPGGIGTMLELFYTWQLMQVKHTCHIPLILLGKQWKGLIKWMEKEPLASQYLKKDDMRLVFLANDAKEAMRMIKTAHNHFKEGKDNICLNYKRYKLY